MKLLWLQHSVERLIAINAKTSPRSADASKSSTIKSRRSCMDHLSRMQRSTGKDDICISAAAQGSDVTSEC